MARRELNAFPDFRGLHLEFECAERAPGVVAVRKRFASRPPSTGTKLADDEVVEVDVVAQDGLLWIECKSEKGDVSPSLVPQALAMQKMARAACNRRRFGRAPEVAVYLTGTLGQAEADVLREAGIWVISAAAGAVAGADVGSGLGAGSEGGGGGGGGGGSCSLLEGLPPAPPPPVLANLDVTALFALVSEVSNSEPGELGQSPAMREWAALKPQHAACLQAELEQPLHLADMLLSQYGYERLVAHHSVVERFEKILHTVGGARERRRWRDEWKSRILVTAHINTEEDDSTAECDDDEEIQLGREARRRGVRGLTRISKPQLDAFEFGEVEMAKTFTANGRAVTLAAEQGVFLEAFVFRAIWLVGL